MRSEQEQALPDGYMLIEYLVNENRRLQQELDQLTREIIESNHGVMALMLENLQKTNEEQKEKIEVQEVALLRAEKLASLGRLTAGVAHEINNPTTFIRGNIEILQQYWPMLAECIRTEAPPTVQHIKADIPAILQEIHRGTERIVKIVNALRTFSRQESIEFADIDLKECIQDSYVFVRNEFYDHKVEFINTLTDSIMILAAKSKMEQVFINLFLNAVHAMEGLTQTEKKVIEIGALSGAAESWVEIYVKDNGCGISQEHLKEIFSPFFTTRQNQGGTGLGLSIVYGIISEHNGTITVNSKENSGTVVTITLPLKG